MRILDLMAAHGSLGEFVLSTGDWKSYVERAKLYFTANDIIDASKRRAVLLSSCGDATYRRIKDVLSPRAPAETTFKAICDAMAKHLQPESSEIVQRFRFNTRVRLPQESIATYVTQLKRLAEHCNFGDTARLNEMIRDRLVCGIAHEKWQQRLLAEDNLTYNKAYKMLLSLEASEREVKDISGEKRIHQVRQQPPKKSFKPQDGRKPPSDTKTKPCYRCGGAHNLEKCRFKDAECPFLQQERPYSSCLSSNG